MESFQAHVARIGSMSVMASSEQRVCVLFFSNFTVQRNSFL